eukprot:c32347_g1_i1.p1 GENE.c32347_g1_i1~~c32347_g1_i1.p1  ORF type:complete len:359 (+),score=74.12 c32347_g1_i1:1-1077(+)
MGEFSMDQLEEIVKDLGSLGQEEEEEEEVFSQNEATVTLVEGHLFKVRHRFKIVEWKERWGVVQNTRQLHYFKVKSDKKPKQIVFLEGCSLVMSPENTDCPERPFSFALTHPLRKTVYLALPSAEEFEKWVQTITSLGVPISSVDGKGLPVHRFTLSSDAPPAHKMSFKTRAQKYIASKAITTKVGVDIIQTFFGESGVESIEAIHDFTVAIADEQTAEKLETNILKLAAKLAVLVKNNVIVDQQLLVIMPTVAQWCEAFIGLYGSYRGANTKLDKREQYLTSLVELGWKIENWLQDIIKPHLGERSSQRVDTVFRFYMNEDLLTSLSLKEHYLYSQTLLDSVLKVYHIIKEYNLELS